MTLNARRANRDTTRLDIDPPTFSPPRGMRGEYLAKRREELPALFAQAEAGEWKPVMRVLNHVRGCGAMYGFEEMGNAAEEAGKAAQDGGANCAELLQAYAEAVNSASV